MEILHTGMLLILSSIMQVVSMGMLPILSSMMQWVLGHFHIEFVKDQKAYAQE